MLPETSEADSSLVSRPIYMDKHELAQSHVLRCSQSYISGADVAGLHQG